MQAFQSHSVKRKMEREKALVTHVAGCFLLLHSERMTIDKIPSLRIKTELWGCLISTVYGLFFNIYHSFCISKEKSCWTWDDEKENISGSKPAKLFLLLSCFYLWTNTDTLVPKLLFVVRLSESTPLNLHTNTHFKLYHLITNFTLNHAGFI